MTEKTDKNFEDFIKKCIEDALGINQKETKTETPFRKLTDIKEEEEDAFDTILEFSVNKKTGQTGLIINHTLLASWNKKLSEALLDNIEASFLLLREDLK